MTKFLVLLDSLKQRLPNYLVHSEKLPEQKILSEYRVLNVWF